MIFSELYSAYYNAVAAILREAVQKPVTREDMRRIVEAHAFGESVLNIEPALTEGRWPLIQEDGTGVLKHAPTMPLTTLQKRWLKAISLDPRIHLFVDEIPGLEEVEPLFKPDDYLVYDKYQDGDPYDKRYVRNFRMILEAIHDRQPVFIEYRNRKDIPVRTVIRPDWLEYSEKDDKFRLFGSGRSSSSTVNMARIIRCRPYTKPFEVGKYASPTSVQRIVIFELTDSRNALERVLMHFAHFEKAVERIDDDRYRVTLHYEKDDETEIVIRILSFGPMVKVAEPQRFVNLIRDRLIKQMNKMNS